MADDMEKSIETLEVQLREQMAHARTATRSVRVIGIILVAIVFGILTWIYSEIKVYSEPKEVAIIVSGIVYPKLDSLLDDMEETLGANAPEYVAQMGDALFENLATLRKHGVNAINGRVDRLAHDLEGRAVEMGDELAEEHKETLIAVFEAAKVEGNDEAIAEALKEPLEDLIGIQLNVHLKEFDAYLAKVEAYLDRLDKPHEELAKVDKVQKDAVTWVLITVADLLEGMLPEGD